MKRSAATVAVVTLAMAAVAALTGLDLVEGPGGAGQAGPSVGESGSAAPEPVPATAKPAAFAGLKVLLLGDSLAAGEGGRSYLNGTDQPHQRCHRSAAGWFAGTAADVTNLGCSRATTWHLTSAQMDPAYNARPEAAQLEAASGENPDITLVMVGGNDIRFAEIFNECVLSEQDCTANPEFTVQALRAAEALPRTLTGAYRTVAAGTGNGAVLVPAYPQLFTGTAADCGRISPAEAAFATELTGTLNRSIRTAAEQAAAGGAAVQFVPDTEHALSGHGACDPDPYVHTVLPTALIDAAQEESAAQELLHPTSAGYSKLTEALAQWLASNVSVIPPAP